MQVKAIYSVLDSGLSKLQRCLAYELAARASQRGQVAVSLHELAESIGVSYRTAHRILDDLMVAGFVERFGHGRLQIVAAGEAVDETAIDLPFVERDSDGEREPQPPRVKRFMTMGQDGFPE